MLSWCPGRWELTPEKDDGAYFIDRDPAGFSLVLQCLRGDRLNRNAITERQLAVFLDDARYYSLPAEIVERFLGGKLGPAGEQFSQESYGGMVVKDNGRVALYPVDERDSQEHSSMWDDMGGWVTGTNVYGGQDHVVITLHIEHAKANMAFGVVEEGWLDGGDGPDFDCRYELHNRGYTGGKASGSQSKLSRESLWHAGVPPCVCVLAFVCDTQPVIVYPFALHIVHIMLCVPRSSVHVCKYLADQVTDS